MRPNTNISNTLCLVTYISNLVLVQIVNRNDVQTAQQGFFVGFDAHILSRHPVSVGGAVMTMIGLKTWLPLPVDGDMELCLENSQSVDGDTKTSL